MHISDVRRVISAKRLAALFTILLLMIGMSLIATAKPANAWNSLGCKWGTKTVKLSAPAPYISYPHWRAAVSSWGGLDAKFSLNPSGTAHVHGLNENRGNTVPWTGIARKKGTVSGVPTCTKGKWSTGKMEVVMNWSHVKKYSATQRNGVAAHELGHAFGLAHNPARYNILMFPTDDRTVSKPSSDDKAGVNALY